MSGRGGSRSARPVPRDDTTARAALRRRVAVEIAVLGTATVLFVLFFPHRNVAVHASLAGVAAVALAANARFTRERIWSRFPPPVAPDDRGREAWGAAGAFTVAGLAVLLAIGIARGLADGGGADVARRLGDGRAWLAVPVYFAWALLQQTLFQFYLLGRLLVLLPRTAAVVLTGIAYALVHAPDVAIVLPTAAAGVVWTAIWLRDRRIVPIALSHAVLGAALYDWVRDVDLLARWWAAWGGG